MDQGNQYQFQGATPTPSTSQTGHIGQSKSAGKGLGQDLQVESSGQVGQMTCYHCLQPGHSRSHGTKTERSDQPDE